MTRFRLSVRAATDVTGIANYTIERFGIEQSRRYRVGLERCLRSLAEIALLGQKAEELSANLRRFEYESHAVYYRPENDHRLLRRICAN